MSQEAPRDAIPSRPGRASVIAAAVIAAAVIAAALLHGNVDHAETRLFPSSATRTRSRTGSPGPGIAEILLDTALDPEQRDCAEALRLSAESLLGILNDILDFSKIEAGRLQLE